jgi:hypothetical protein
MRTDTATTRSLLPLILSFPLAAKMLMSCVSLAVAEAEAVAEVLAVAAVLAECSKSTLQRSPQLPMRSRSPQVQQAEPAQAVKAVTDQIRQSEPLPQPLMVVAEAELTTPQAVTVEMEALAAAQLETALHQEAPRLLDRATQEGTLTTTPRRAAAAVPAKLVRQATHQTLAMAATASTGKALEPPTQAAAVDRLVAIQLDRAVLAVAVTATTTNQHQPTAPQTLAEAVAAFLSMAAE